MPLPDGSIQVFSEVSRFATLDVNGFPAVGSNTFTTNLMLKATFTPVMETGADIVVISANADIAGHFKHGDMPKYFTAAIELATPDPVLHQMITGGTLFTDSTTALGTPTGTLAAVGQTTLGTLGPGTYAYRVSGYNAYGETQAMAEATGTVASGTTGTMVVSGFVLPATAIGGRVFGRTSGAELFLGTVPNIGTQATSASSGTASPTSLTVTALTKPIPQGTTFTIAGDTNTPKIVFTASTTAGVGATNVGVTESQTITTTIAAGNIQPCFVDTGTIIPSAGLPSSDTTAGPGNVGWQAPALAVVGNPNGVSIECWGKAILGGTQASYLPYGRWVFPGCRNFHEEARAFDNAVMANMYTGQAFENPNWGSGPFGDWQFDSSKWANYARASRFIEPVSGLSPVPATA
jgi:hypothetical protein